MKYVVAVSGGVDSVVLLDMLVRQGSHELTVAHFDHGIRPESDQDAAFVKELAERNGLTFVSERAELGLHTGEEAAREHRYRFLKAAAQRSQAQLVTAHHQDDMIETIAINLSRGTGWRGLAVFGDTEVKRPLVGYTKAELYTYALERGLEWVEDETNVTNAYLRNRLRKRLADLTDDSRERLTELWLRQAELARDIDEACAMIDTDSRYLYTMIDEVVAIELLRAHLASKSLSLTRPQRQRLLLAVKTFRAGSVFEAGEGVRVIFTLGEFIVKHP